MSKGSLLKTVCPRCKGSGKSPDHAVEKAVLLAIEKKSKGEATGTFVSKT